MKKQDNERKQSQRKRGTYKEESFNLNFKHVKTFQNSILVLEEWFENETLSSQNDKPAVVEYHENKTKKSKWYQMMFSFNQSIKLGHYLYNNITDNDLFIKRKYDNYMSIITNPKHLERIKKVLK